MAPTQTKVVFFDLDGTLFDHSHSLRHAISVIHSKYTALAKRTVEELIRQYNASLQQAYDAYLDKAITYAEADTRKIHLFFASLGLPEPSFDEVQQFRDAYKAVYRANRRATPGSIEALVRLREHGYRTSITTNGKIQDQTYKAKAIGILHVIDCIITSSELLETTYMIGDSVDSDIKGALDAQLATILYSRTAQDSQRPLYGQQIPAIRHMEQVLGHFDITIPQFEPRFASAPGQLIIEGIGIDMVTEPPHGLHISKEGVRVLTERVVAVLECAVKIRCRQAVFHLLRITRAITIAASPSSHETINGLELRVTITSTIRVECIQLALDTATENEAWLREIVAILQAHCHHLMSGRLAAAISVLHSAMLMSVE
ncbi:HAD-like domain-containing protein [Trichoderma austrokoningii]